MPDLAGDEPSWWDSFSQDLPPTHPGRFSATNPEETHWEGIRKQEQDERDRERRARQARELQQAGEFELMRLRARDWAEQKFRSGKEEDTRARVQSLLYDRADLDRIKPASWLVSGVLTASSLSLLAGKFGTYKSFVAVALACSVGTGVPFLGRQVERAGPVVYVAAEGVSGLRGRVIAWEHGYHDGAPIPRGRLYVVGGPINLIDDAAIAALLEECLRIRPVLVVWDTLHRCAPGVDENSSQETGRVVDALTRVRERLDCTQLVVHHTGHSGVRSRGSSSLEDDFDNSWVIKLGTDGEDRSARNQRTMEHRKIKDGELSESIPIALASAGDSAYVKRTEAEPPRSWLVAKAYAARLDEAGVPRDYGRVKVAEALTELGIGPVGHTMASDVSKLRRAPDYVPSDPRPGTSRPRPEDTQPMT